MAEQERAFKGVWIPAEIWLNKDLTLVEKVIFADIDSYCSRYQECYLGNKHFAKMLGITEHRISQLISTLVEKGYISRKIQYKEDGKTIDKRLLKTTWGYSNFYQGGIAENCYRGIAENVKENINIENINKEYIYMGAKPQKKKKTVFVPPTREEIAEYIQTKIEEGKMEYSNINIDTFFNYYNEADWHMSNGRKIKSWKQCLVMWANRQWNSRPVEPPPKKIVYVD